MSVKLHKVTVFVADYDGSDESSLDKLRGDCSHNWGAKIVEIQTAKFDRIWSDDDPLNKYTTFENRALLDSLVDGMPKEEVVPYR